MFPLRWERASSVRRKFNNYSKSQDADKGLKPLVIGSVDFRRRVLVFRQENFAGAKTHNI